MQPPVLYLPNFITAHKSAFADLLELPWNRVGDTPRSECYFNDTPAPYTYGQGRGRRTYEPQGEWHPVVRSIRSELELELHARGIAGPMDVCFCNRYDNQHDQLGWHADDSPEMDHARPVVTVSFGAAREIWMRHASTATHDRYASGRVTADAHRQVLASGSALVMLPGMQCTWQHRIPKHDRPCGPRISLTFRGYVKGD